jgi:hypothetical protein
MQPDLHDNVVESAQHVATRDHANYAATLADRESTHAPLVHQVHDGFEVRFGMDEDRPGIHDIGDCRIVQIDPVPQGGNQVKIADDTDGVTVVIDHRQTGKTPVHEQIRGASRRLFRLDDNN